MSGVEVVGLTLAILPLLVSAAEHYDDCIRPILRYRKLVSEVQTFKRRLKVQKAIFINQCRIVLESVVEHDDAVRMLAARSSDPSWRDSNLENELLNRFGDAKEACVTSIELITEKLRSIQEESQDLQDSVDHDKDVKHRLMKKIRICLSKSPLEGYITALRSLNDDFAKLSNQIRFTDEIISKSSRDTPAKLKDNGVSRYRMIREASAKVYEALVRACTKHSEHLALLCIEPIYDSIKGTNNNHIKFRIAFSRCPLTGRANDASISEQDEPMWFMIDTLWDDDVGSKSVKQNQDNNLSPTNHLLARTLKRELNSATTQPTKKKNVRFNVQDSALTLQTPILPSLDPIAIPRLRTDFCDVLRKHVKTVCNSPTCLGLLESNGSTKHRVYTPPLDLCHRKQQKSALSDLIDSENSPRNNLSTYEKLHLAKILSIAVLQYCSTPWLSFAWRSQDIFFFDKQVSNQQKVIDFSSPHINVSIKEFQQPRRQLSFPSLELAPNSLLFSLGIILLELAYSSSLQSLQQQCDLEGGRPSRYTEFFVAKRLSDTVVREMGGAYATIVRKLLQCNFGQGDDLNDTKLQGTFHRDVVCELERLEQDFSDMKIS